MGWSDSETVQYPYLMVLLLLRRWQAGQTNLLKRDGRVAGGRHSEKRGGK